MYKSVEIKNFRLFRDFKIEGLERINLIVGGNNVGKTSLLEALYLQQGPSNPELETRINVQRGYAEMTGLPVEIWGSLFLDLDTNNLITITTKDETGKTSNLEIAIAEIEKTLLTSKKQPAVVQEMQSRAVSDSALQLKFSENGKLVPSGRAYIVSDGIQLEMKKEIKRPNSHFVFARNRTSLYTNAKKYGSLQSEKREAPIIKYMNYIEPRLKDLKIIPSKLGPIIWGDLGGNNLLPIFTLGDGVDRLLSIILAIYDSPNGIVLIDEVENGFYHGAMQKVWDIIHKIAVDLNVQVFATTHSQECIYSAYKALHETAPQNFMFFRLDHKNGDIVSTGYDMETLEAALDMNLEVR